MAEAHVEVAISSWWGPNDRTDTAFRHIIADVMNRADNPYPNLRWALYYEKEGSGNPTSTEIISDLNYIAANYTTQPGYLKINGKPVIFVYADANDGADMAARWAQARAATNFYVVLKVYAGYTTDPNQPDSWHQYGPAVQIDSQAPYAVTISPGFWQDGQSPRLARNLTNFKNAVIQMVNSSVTWKLITTWNEYGEGTMVEPADQVIQGTGTTTATLDPNGTPFKNSYIDVLNQTLPALEAGTGVPDTTLPTVAITNPPNNSFVSRGSTVSISATAADNTKISKVEFYVNNVLKCTDMTTPYSCNWLVPAAKNVVYTLQAKAYDTSDNTASSTSRVTSR
jgi:hypothetical protein